MVGYMQNGVTFGIKFERYNSEVSKGSESNNFYPGGQGFCAGGNFMTGRWLTLFRFVRAARPDKTASGEHWDLTDVYTELVALL